MNPVFYSELCSLLNRHNKEKWSNTPDYILANYICECLKTFDNITNQREKWHGRLTDREDNLNKILNDDE